VIDGLSKPEAVFAVGQPLGERAYFGETPGQYLTRHHRGQPRQAKALPEQRPFEGCHILPQEVDGLRIVPQTIIRSTQEEMQHGLECRIPEGSGQGEGALADFDGALRVACARKLVSHIGSNPAQPVLVAQGLGEHLSLAQIREDTVML
jgi:hypothetical protein